ncbi:hypothetical protein GOP47_0002107 [Adiantum capillus-veneris]|uniref:Uncharacterized protein n=1 Tax=Adiantum capillus-veneris TaxID=13818 RepID=A0A9D4V9Q8_ADICA|nr:hypothetical protein GOP47_0002107 [Adiantum capillus-veneris]
MFEKQHGLGGMCATCQLLRHLIFKALQLWHLFEIPEARPNRGSPPFALPIGQGQAPALHTTSVVQSRIALVPVVMGGRSRSGREGGGEQEEERCNFVVLRQRPY